MPLVSGKVACVGVALALFAQAAVAQAPKVDAGDYQRAERMLSGRMAPLVDGAVRNVTWIDGERVAWIVQDARGDHAMRYDVGSDAPVAAFNQSRLVRAINRANPDSDPVKADKLPVFGIKPAGDGRFEISVDGRDYRCTAQKDCVALEQAEHGDEPGVASPDGKSEAFIRDWNLWLRDVATGKETQLTTDGSTDHGYATDNAGWTHSDRAILVWSPDSKKIATFRQDQRKTSTMTLVATNVGAPEAEQWKYPFAGDEHVTMLERVVIDLSGDVPKTIRLQMPPDQHRSTCTDDLSCDGGWEDVQWAPDGETLAFVSTDRGHKSAKLRVADARTGEVRDVFEETVRTQYQSAPGLGSVNWRYLPESGEFLWFSQRSDWGHLYLHDLSTGEEKRQVTSGEWNVTEIGRLDTGSRTLWLKGVGREAGRDPYFVHYYKVGLDGGDVQLLTPENANHVIQPSENGTHFVDTFSTVATAPVTVLRDGDGNLVRELSKVDLTRAKAAGWVAPEPFTVKARDGRTDLHGQMFRAAAFDETKKHPVVVYIYPGPQVGSVRSRSFLPAHLDHQALAELGFVVVAVDGTCTPMRSKSFQDACYGDMADNTLPDQVAALEQLGDRHDWIDMDRIGIWGHSGGGNATAAAMFRYPEVFKVGIAESGNHDNLAYEDDWAERYQGLLEKNRDGSSNYTGQDNASIAKNLEGKLFLLHGMMDDNVPPQSTLLVVDALVKANKDFDLLLLPHARHGFGKDGDYVTRRRWDYFVEHLMGVEPPREYLLKSSE